MQISKQQGRQIRSAMSTMDREQKQTFFLSLLGYAPRGKRERKCEGDGKCGGRCEFGCEK